MKKHLILSLLFFAAVASMHAQVTIGSTDTPTDGAVLDLSRSGSLGLMLPHVELNGTTTYQLGTLQATRELDKYADGAGTVVYNTGGSLAAGIYIWDGTNWLAAEGTLTPPPDTIQVGSNTYTIGDFGDAGWWMTENLREIPVDGVLDKGSDAAVKYFNYPAPAGTADYTTLGSDSTTNKNTYGYLYSWAAATGITSSSGNNGNNSGQTPVQGVCPDHWHLPTDYEWTQLEKEIAMSTAYSTGIAASIPADTVGMGMSTNPAYRVVNAPSLDKKLRAPVKIWATGIFDPGNSKAASEGGFSVLPAGYWDNTAAVGLGTVAYFWSSSSSSSTNAWFREVYGKTNGVARTYIDNYNQFSVRCKKD